MKKLYLLLTLTCAAPTANIVAEQKRKASSEESTKKQLVATYIAPAIVGSVLGLTVCGLENMIGKKLFDSDQGVSLLCSMILIWPTFSHLRVKIISSITKKTKCNSEDKEIAQIIGQITDWFAYVATFIK